MPRDIQRPIRLFKICDLLLSQVLEIRGADDGSGYAVLRKGPRDGDLSHADTALSGKLLNSENMANYENERRRSAAEETYLATISEVPPFM